MKNSHFTHGDVRWNSGEGGKKFSSIASDRSSYLSSADGPCSKLRPMLKESTDSEGTRKIFLSRSRTETVERIKEIAAGSSGEKFKRSLPERCGFHVSLRSDLSL